MLWEAGQLEEEGALEHAAAGVAAELPGKLPACGWEKGKSRGQRVRRAVLCLVGEEAQVASLCCC